MTVLTIGFFYIAWLFFQSILIFVFASPLFNFDGAFYGAIVGVLPFWPINTAWVDNSSEAVLVLSFCWFLVWFVVTRHFAETIQRRDIAILIAKYVLLIGLYPIIKFDFYRDAVGPSGETVRQIVWGFLNNILWSEKIAAYFEAAVPVVLTAIAVRSLIALLHVSHFCRRKFQGQYVNWSDLFPDLQGIRQKFSRAQQMA